MTTPAPPGTRFTPSPLERLIAQVGTAIHTRALYEAEHPQVVQSVTRVLQALDVVCQERKADAVTFLLVDEDLVVDQKALRRGGPYQQNFVVTLRKRGVERLTLAKGLDRDECERFVSAMAGSVVPVSTEHLIVGRVAVATDAPEDEAPLPPAAAGGGADARKPALSIGLVDAAREAWGRLRQDRTGRLTHMEELVWSLMDALSRSTRSVLPLATLKDHDEYLFIHSVNVSLLVLAQARSFGYGAETLHAMGLAALMHDVGKLSLSRAILTKEGKLADDEWQQLRQHTDLGLWTLAQIPGTHPYCMLVAYEHHLRFDGKPNYPELRWPRAPSLVSQMTAVADTFDAVSSYRPYHRPKSRMGALELVAVRAGTFFDPRLAGNFRTLMSRVPA